MRPGRGVVGMVATTAVVAGTAGAVHHHQEQKYANQAAEQQAQQQAAYDQQAAAAPAAPAEDDQMAQLQKLAEMHNAGILTDDEFAAAKAKALGIDLRATQPVPAGTSAHVTERIGRLPTGSRTRRTGMIGTALRDNLRLGGDRLGLAVAPLLLAACYSGTSAPNQTTFGDILWTMTVSRSSSGSC